ncbi:MAG TPA: 1-acyl-sn-glycerol-3-phosphate acyltransferase, partial [Chitinophagaceae bacterium]|nr:1-acyl-sn-glycerol-3-phosphate acyltransferase [Chitinophagaceae bacterium]
MYHLLRVICFTWFLFSGIIPVTYHRRKQSFNRRTIFIMNHQSFIDAANLYTAFPVLFKTLGKTGIEKVPFYGVMYKAVVIRVDRSSLHARALSYRNMRKAL